MSDESAKAVQEAEDQLYMSIDRWGVGKKTTYLISALIDAKVAHAIDELRTPSLPGESNVRPLAGPEKVE